MILRFYYINLNTNIKLNPNKNTKKCIIDFLKFSLCFISGIKSETAMYINPPAAKGSSFLWFLQVGEKRLRPLMPQQKEPPKLKGLYPKTLCFKNKKTSQKRQLN